MIAIGYMITRASPLAVGIGLFFHPTHTSAEQSAGDTLLVTTEWLQPRLQEDLVILHVGGSAEDYEAGHIPNARFISHRSIAANRDGKTYELRPVDQLVTALEEVGLSDGDRVVVYGHPLLAGRMFFTLEYLGHRGRVSLLDGSIEAWDAAGLPLSTERTPVQSGEYTPRVHSTVLVDAAWSLDRLDKTEYAFVDARPNGQYDGGHLPGAGNIYYEDVLTHGVGSVLKSPNTLREMLRDAGVTEGDTVVTYCAIGMRASFLYFVARYLGYETAMYDGSFSEWMHLEGMPISKSTR